MLQQVASVIGGSPTFALLNDNLLDAEVLPFGMVGFAFFPIWFHPADFCFSLKLNTERIYFALFCQLQCNLPCNAISTGENIVLVYGVISH